MFCTKARAFGARNFEIFFVSLDPEHYELTNLLGYKPGDNAGGWLRRGRFMYIHILQHSPDCLMAEITPRKGSAYQTGEDGEGRH